MTASLPLVFVRTGIYARDWRYAAVEELLLLTGSMTIGVLLTGSFSLLAVQLLPGSVVTSVSHLTDAQTETNFTR